MLDRQVTRTKLLGALLRLVVEDVREHDAASLVGHGLRDPEADAPGPTGDDHNLVLEITHSHLLLTHVVMRLRSRASAMFALFERKKSPNSKVVKYCTIAQSNCMQIKVKMCAGAATLLPSDGTGDEARPHEGAETSGAKGRPFSEGL